MLSLIMFFLTFNAFVEMESLYSCIDQEVISAKLELEKNKNISKIELDGLQNTIDEIWSNIKESSISEHTGSDCDLRPAYVIMQGIIEKAQNNCLSNGLIKNTKWIIFTPRMPTPLMACNSSTLETVSLKDPYSFGKYRNKILIDFLKSGGTVYALYDSKAKSFVSEREDFRCYVGNLSKYSNINDIPELDFDSNKNLLALVGAYYILDGFSITIESRQAGQAGNEKENTWSIRFGGKNIDRLNKLKEVVSFLGYDL